MTTLRQASKDWEKARESVALDDHIELTAMGDLLNNHVLRCCDLHLGLDASTTWFGFGLILTTEQLTEAKKSLIQEV